MLEPPPEGLTTDPDGPLAGMLGPDADALAALIADAAKSAMAGAHRHARGLAHLAAVVAENM
jgi:hypothetical protein